MTSDLHGTFKVSWSNLLILMGNCGSGMLRMDGETWWSDSWEEQKVLGPRDRLYFSIVTKAFYPWAPKSLLMVVVAMKLKDTCSLEEKL